MEKIPFYYVVTCASEADAIHSLRSLNAFVRTPGGHVRLTGPDRVVVWRNGADLYLSPGALSLAGYLEPDPELPRNPDLAGPEITPSRKYPNPPLVASRRVSVEELPPTSVLMLGEP